MTSEVRDFPGAISPAGILAAGAALGATLRLRRRRWPHRHVPDILGIFSNGAVGGEPRHARDIEDAGAGPSRHHLPARIDVALRLVVGIEVGGDHVGVVETQRVRYAGEAVRLVRRELAVLDRGNGT